MLHSTQDGSAVIITLLFRVANLPVPLLACLHLCGPEKSAPHGVLIGEVFSGLIHEVLPIHQ